jgi:hypothetical protein
MSITYGIRGGTPNAPGWASGRYYMCPNTNSLSTSAALGNNTLRAVPFYVPNAVSVAKVGSEITIVGEAGSKLRLGIYADDGTGRPGALVVDAGQIAGDSATVQEITLGTPVPLGPGWYWAAACVQSAPTTQPTVRLASIMTAPTDCGTTIPSAGLGTYGWGATSISGAFPSTLTPTSAISTAARIFVKT